MHNSLSIPSLYGIIIFQVRKVALVLIIAVLALSAAVCIATTQHDDVDSIETSIVGIGSFDDYAVGITVDDLESHHLEPGDRLKLVFPDRSYDSMYTKNHIGPAMLTIYLNYSVDSGEITISMATYAIRSVLSYDVGTDITIEHYSVKVDYYELIPNYIGGCSEDRGDYVSDEAYCNFRALEQGDILDDRIYRSASPVVPFGTRNACCDRLLEDAGVENLLILNLTDRRVENYRTDDCQYTYGLYDAGKVTCMRINPYLLTDSKAIKDVMSYISSTEGNIGISCNLGKDRTGMICAMLNALAGASYEEIREDYMITVTNLYGVTPGSVEYDTVAGMTVNVFFYLFTDPDADVTSLDWMDIDTSGFDPYNDVRSFLKEHVGMTDEEIDGVIASIRRF